MRQKCKRKFSLSPCAAIFLLLSQHPTRTATQGNSGPKKALGDRKIYRCARKNYRGDRPFYPLPGFSAS